MEELGGNSRGFTNGDRNQQHGNPGFYTFICSARPLRNVFFVSLVCFAAGIGLITYGTYAYISLSQTKPGLAWQRLIYIVTGAIAVVSGAVALGKVCCLYSSFRRHQKQTAQNVPFHGNLGPQQPQLMMTGQYNTTPYQPYGPGQGQPQPGYPATVGPQYPAGAYPRQQPYPQTGGAMPNQQPTAPVQTGVSDWTSSQSGYPPTAHAQEPTTTSASLPPSYDDVVRKEQNQINTHI